ncbi:MAG TPA: 2-oxo acid dehydrogenase subunit E2 [Mucilaginibacter sp.]|jgi:2-oxoglutarate dehydrogenase E2 component (dihydrolipoamide succinyltransferase)|nr:2-oxo acid dehydrogenase subunit E2 [Mucilaginibacter sp.]
MAKYKLLLPKMGESVAEATVIRWTKRPGDQVEADETVMEIATDKVDSDVPSPVSGKLLEQLCKENDVVQVGAVIAVIETAEPEEVKETVASPAPPAAAPTFHIEEPVAGSPRTFFAPPSVVETPAVAAEPERHFFETPEPEKAEPTEAKQPVFAEQREDVAAPVPYVEQIQDRHTSNEEEAPKGEGRFYSPLVKNIAAQEGIGNAELDKIPGSGAEGRLTKDDLLNYIQNRYQSVTEVPAAEPAPTTPGTPIEEETWPEISESRTAPEPVKEPEPAIEEIPEPVAVTGEQVVEAPKPEPVAETPEPEPVRETPAAGQVVEAPGVAAESPKPATSMSGGDEIIEMDRMRRLIADHMVMSKHTSPHVTSFVEADVTNLVLWREKIKGAFEKREGEKITFTPLFIEAVVRSIKDMPMINVQVNGTQIIKKRDINISMATALPSGNLIVPVIKRADELNLIGLTKAVNDLAGRARIGKLKPDDTQGGTFTITNVGSFGNVMGTPIINQPQVAILAVGAIRKKPAVIETLQGDMIGIRHMMFLSLSYDHRVVDGALGGSFVRRVADYLENWDPGREI